MISVTQLVLSIIKTHKYSGLKDFCEKNGLKYSYYYLVFKEERLKEKHIDEIGNALGEDLSALKEIL